MEEEERLTTTGYTTGLRGETITIMMKTAMITIMQINYRSGTDDERQRRRRLKESSDC